MSNQKHFLVNFKDNYADEFDLHGFAVFTEENWVEFKRSVEAYTQYPIECGFGTNEHLEYKNAREFMNALKVKEVTKQFADDLQNALSVKTINVFGYYTFFFGFFPDPDTFSEPQ